MAMLASEVREWLDTLGSGASVGIDDGGLTLVLVDKNGDDPAAWIEVGGVPDGPTFCAACEDSSVMATTLASGDNRMDRCPHCTEPCGCGDDTCVGCYMGAANSGKGAY